MTWALTDKLKNFDFLTAGWVIICIGLFGVIYKIIENLIDFLFGVNSLLGDLITYCFGLGMLVILVWMVRGLIYDDLI